MFPKRYEAPPLRGEGGSGPKVKIRPENLNKYLKAMNGESETGSTYKNFKMNMGSDFKKFVLGSFVKDHRIKAKRSKDDQDRVDQKELMIKQKKDAKIAAIRKSGRNVQEKIENLEESYNRADLLEDILLPHISINSWFGDEYGRLSKGDKFDDFFNGSDLIFTIKDDHGKQMQMTIDVTLTNNLSEITDKIEHISDGLISGKMASAQYYENPDLPLSERQAHEISMVPNVLLPLSPETFDELKQKTADFFSGRSKKAESSTLPYAILDCFLEQLKNQKLFIEQVVQSEAEDLPNSKEMIDILDTWIFEIEVRRDEINENNGTRKLDEMQEIVANTKFG